jgi:hypothetical protein
MLVLSARKIGHISGILIHELAQSSSSYKISRMVALLLIPLLRVLFSAPHRIFAMQTAGRLLRPSDN